MIMNHQPCHYWSNGPLLNYY